MTVDVRDPYLVETEQVDPEIYQLIKEEEQYQVETVRLIPSENYTSRAVMEATGSVLANKYSEGYPGKRYYEGQRNVDQIETIVIDRAKALFEEMLEGEKTGYIARFEDERLNDLASPIAKAWRRVGVKSRIAASSFYRWLASTMWPGEVTDKQLLEFAMNREP